MAALAVLGVTGSIGLQTLEVADQIGMRVTGVGAHRPSAELIAIAHRYQGAEVAVTGGTESERAAFAEAVGRDRVGFGSEAARAMAARRDQTVMNAIVGLAGLGVTLAAAEAGNRLALANKESMVAAGPLVTAALQRSGGELIPVDSEHSAVFQCLVGESEPARLILTASGGPFRGRNRADLTSVTPAEALRHPNWKMGPRITIDSATLANKALEVLEAMALFQLSIDQIEVVIHPESVIHSMVVFGDGSIKAQLGPPDMRLPIAYALTYPRRAPGIIPEFSLAGSAFHFEQPDVVTFPALELGYAAGRRGGTAPAVFNAADEIAVAAFLSDQLSFPDIPAVIEATLAKAEVVPIGALADVVMADQQARRLARESIARTLR